MMDISYWNEIARQALGFGLGVLIQSSITLVIGLIVAALLRSRGAELQSIIYKSALCAVAGMLCISLIFGHVIRPLWQIAIPPPVSPSLANAPVQPSMSQIAPARETVVFSTQKTLVAYRPAVTAPVKQTPAIRAPRIDLANIYAACGSIWLAGTVSVWLWLLIGCVSLVRLYKQSSPIADLELVEFVCSLASEGKFAIPELRCHKSVKAPHIARLKRPVIFLPEDYKDHFSPRDIRMAVVHELAHIRQRDFEWNIAILMGCGLLWPQALLWITHRKWRQNIEERCDEWVVSYFTSASEYARCLLEVAERQSGFSIAPVTGIGMVYVKSSLGMRIRRLLDNTHHRIAMLSPLVKSSVGAAAVVVAVMTACLISTGGAKGAMVRAAKAPKQIAAAVAQLSKPKPTTPLEKQKMAIERNRIMLSHQITLSRLAKKALPSAISLAAVLTNSVGVTLPAAADTSTATTPVTSTTVVAATTPPAKPQAKNGLTIQKVPLTTPNVTWSLTAPGTPVVPNSSPGIAYYYDTTPGVAQNQNGGQELNYYIQTLPVETRKVGANGETLVSVNADNIPIRAALAQIFATSPASYVVKEDVTGTVTAHLHDVPFTMAIQSIIEASSAQVTYEVKSVSSDPNTKQSEDNQLYVFRSMYGGAESLLPRFSPSQTQDTPISLRYDNAKLSDIIADLCRQDSIQYSLPGDIGSQKISIDISNVSVRTAIKEVLALSIVPLNWTIVNNTMSVQTKAAADAAAMAREGVIAPQAQGFGGSGMGGGGFGGGMGGSFGGN